MRAPAAALAAVVLATMLHPATADVKCGMCGGGKHGMGSLLHRTGDRDFCSTYAARVIDQSTAVDCGHLDLADALAKCLNLGRGTPPQCYTHQSAGVGIIVGQNIAAISIWAPVVWKIVKLRRKKDA